MFYSCGLRLFSESKLLSATSELDGLRTISNDESQSSKIKIETITKQVNRQIDYARVPLVNSVSVSV